MPTEIVEQLEAQLIANQFTLCNRQKQMHDYFKTVEVATKDVSFVDSLDIDNMELESINTTVASVAVSALMRNEVTPGGSSTPKCPRTSTGAIS